MVRPRLLLRTRPLNVAIPPRSTEAIVAIAIVERQRRVGESDARAVVAAAHRRDHRDLLARRGHAIRCDELLRDRDAAVGQRRRDRRHRDAERADDLRHGRARRRPHAYARGTGALAQPGEQEHLVLDLRHRDLGQITAVDRKLFESSEQRRGERPEFRGCTPAIIS